MDKLVKCHVFMEHSVVWLCTTSCKVISQAAADDDVDDDNDDNVV